MAILYFSNENFACSKEQIMHKELSLALTLLKFFKNSMKPDIYSIENSVDPYQDLHCFPYNMTL